MAMLIASICTAIYIIIGIVLTKLIIIRLNRAETYPFVIAIHVLLWPLHIVIMLVAFVGLMANRTKRR